MTKKLSDKLKSFAQQADTPKPEPSVQIDHVTVNIDAETYIHEVIYTSTHRKKRGAFYFLPETLLYIDRATAALSEIPHPAKEIHGGRKINKALLLELAAATLLKEAAEKGVDSELGRMLINAKG